MKLGKMFLMLLFSSFVGIVANPELPFASDSVALTGLSNVGITETILPEPESVREAQVEAAHTEPSYIGMNYTDSAYTEPPRVESVYIEPVHEETIYHAPTDHIAINGRTIDLNYTETTGEDAGGAALAWYYKSGKFIYGHNSWNVFGFLDSAYDGGWLMGMSFSVTMDGVVSDYRVANYRLYDYDANQPAYLWYNGEGIKMNPIVKAKLDGTPYRMAIMTCYAGSSKRLVIFAN